VEEEEHREENALEADCPLALAPDSSQAPNNRLASLNVLLVEDNIINQKVGLRMLSTLGCRTTVRTLSLSLSLSPFGEVCVTYMFGLQPAV
jgi:hypothetical protein